MRTKMKHLVATAVRPSFGDDDALIPLGELGIAKQDDLAAVVDSGDYLPRVQLMSAASQLCKTGEFPINSYAFVQGQDYFDLGKEADVLVIHWRSKAIDMSGDEIISSYDAESELFKSIQTKSGGKDSGCMYGPEYLVYVPKNKQFATFFLGSKSARREARSMHQRLSKAATLKSALIETKSFSWQAPKITPCSASFEIPGIELIKPQLEKFNGEKGSNVEAPAEVAEGRAR